MPTMPLHSPMLRGSVFFSFERPHFGVFGACHYLLWVSRDDGTWARARPGEWAWANGGKGDRGGLNHNRR